MGSRGMLLLRGAIPINQMFNHRCKLPKVLVLPGISRGMQHFSTSRITSSLQPPDVPSLAETARISLTPQEVEEFTPKIRQVVDWFRQLQDVELHGVEPALRADMECENLREDIPEAFGNREAIISGIPNYEEPYIKVPKVLNKE